MVMVIMSEYIGVIYPIPKQFINRFFLDKKNVFVKFLSHESTKLKVKQKIIFYESHGSKKLIGEGRIEKIEFLTPVEIYKKYSNDLFLDEKELYKYVGDRKLKKTLTIKLDNLNKYDEPVLFPKPITLAGLYINEKQYRNTIVNTRVKSK